MTLLKALIVLMPWRLKRALLTRIFGYRIAKTARIGLSWIYPKHLVMGDGAWIGHLTAAVNLDLVELAEHTRVGRNNWITGYPSGAPKHFLHQPDRVSSLTMGPHAAMTKGHHIDCTAPVSIGAYTILAGYQTQILTHSIDLRAGRQHSEPVSIGERCFVGTKSVLLGGATLPDLSVLGAMSLLNRSFDEPRGLYGGNPAQRLKDLGEDWGYFTRERGFVD